MLELGSAGVERERHAAGMWVGLGIQTLTAVSQLLDQVAVHHATTPAIFKHS